MASHPSLPPSISPPSSKRLLPGEECHRGSSAPALSPAGYIFMCSGATKPDCYWHQVLGLPRRRLDAVSRIKRGAALFLFDTDIKHLHGPYRADSDGGLDLVPAAFQGRFPAQVKFKIEGDFMPLHESSVRSAIKENYVKGKFSPELNSTQVEKLRALFQPVALFPESAPPHYVDHRPPASAVYFPPPASHPAQPVAYAHYPTAYVPPPYAPPSSYLAPPTAQPTAYPYSVTAGYGYQAGYEAYGPMPSTYQYPCYTAYQNDPYQLDNVTSHDQQSTYDRAAYDAGHGTAASNLQLVKRYGFSPSDATEGTARISDVDESQLAVTYTTHATSRSAHGASSSVYVAAAAPAHQ
ncbi:hypothetical protein QOZ80_9BG0713300 [Eleusine coracana subsp. coracana]|nr:hypothetical protein QOZ80_9BG0713300 [Eleusine coracana subsp. coracana]